MYYKIIAVILCVCVTVLRADEESSARPPSELAIELPIDFEATSLNQDEVDAQNQKLEAYIQGLLDARYAKYKVVAVVRNGQIILSNLPNDIIRANKIIAYVKKISTMQNVFADTTVEFAASADDDVGTLLTKEDYTGIWFPQSTILFPSQVANPRQIAFTVGPRFHDILAGNLGTAFSFGDQFPIYRWANVWRWHGDLQLELEAGLFAVFCFDKKWFPMQNADYYAGIPVTYATGPWAYRARFYHVSTHVGDEYMDDHRWFRRKNKSFEAVDFFASYQNDTIHIYGGPGVIVHSDPEFHMPPIYFEYGIEARAFRRNFTQLYGQPFLAIHVQNAQEHNFAFDPTYAIGYEWGKIQGFGRKIRIYFEYHDGFSPDGEFSHNKTTYYALKLSYGF